MANVETVAGTNSEDVVRKYFAAWSNHDLDAMAAMLDPDFVSVDPLNPAKNREEYLKSQEPTFKAFPDFEVKILNILAKGDTVAVESSGSVTFKNPFEIAGQTIPPTGRRITSKIAFFYKVNSNGLIEEEREYYDTAELLREFGMKA